MKNSAFRAVSALLTALIALFLIAKQARYAAAFCLLVHVQMHPRTCLPMMGCCVAQRFVRRLLEGSERADSNPERQAGASHSSLPLCTCPGACTHLRA